MGDGGEGGHQADYQHLERSLKDCLLFVQLCLPELYFQLLLQQHVFVYAMGSAVIAAYENEVAQEMTHVVGYEEEVVGEDDEDGSLSSSTRPQRDILG